MAINEPSHLATARLAQATGHWPAVNTFSYTFPETRSTAVPRVPGHDVGDFAPPVGRPERRDSDGLDGHILAGRALGGSVPGRAVYVLWMLALWALQRRMVLRPDMFTMLAFGAQAGAGCVRARPTRAWRVPLAHSCG